MNNDQDQTLRGNYVRAGRQLATAWTWQWVLAGCWWWLARCFSCAAWLQYASAAVWAARKMGKMGPHHRMKWLSLLLTTTALCRVPSHVSALHSEHRAEGSGLKKFWKARRCRENGRPALSVWEFRVVLISRDPLCGDLAYHWCLYSQGFGWW